MNTQRNHLYIIPEDDAERQIAGGFKGHWSVDQRRVQIMRPSGGWGKVLAEFVEEYVPRLRSNSYCHVVMLVDFDGWDVARRTQFDDAIPAELKERVFVIGPQMEPEDLKRSMQISFERIGLSLADDCQQDRTDTWQHDQLVHNEAERVRLLQVVKPFLFT